MSELKPCPTCNNNKYFEINAVYHSERSSYQWVVM